MPEAKWSVDASGRERRTRSPSAAEQERKEIELLAADRVKALKVAGLVWCLSTSAPREFHVTGMRKGVSGKSKTTQKSHY
jgi:hypothetical protein